MCHHHNSEGTTLITLTYTYWEAHTIESDVFSVVHVFYPMNPVLLKCYTVSQYMCKCNIHYAHNKSTHSPHQFSSNSEMPNSIMHWPLIPNSTQNAQQTWKVQVKVQQTHYRPGQSLRVTGGWGSQISRQSVHVGCKIVSPMQWPPLPHQEIFLVLISVRGWVILRYIVWLEGLCQWKIPLKSLGIEPMTLQLVA